MKKTALLILALSLLLTACGAEAKQPDEPGPAPQIDQISPAEPEQLAQEEKPEISQEALETIFETVYASAADSHPEDWSIDFQITDEVGKITAAIPEDVKAPSDLRVMYTEWRTEQTAQDTPEPPAPEAEEPAISEPPEEPVAQQPTTSSNKGTSSGGSSGTTSQSSSQESSGTSGSSDDWRKNMITDTEGYIDVTNGESSYNNPDAERGLIGGSAPSTTDTDSTTTPAPSTNSDTNSKIHPAGTTIELNGKTYTSTGEAIYGTWTICTDSNGDRYAISSSGSKRPLSTNDVDLSDGGASIADEMTTNELGSGSFNG